MYILLVFFWDFGIDCDILPLELKFFMVFEKNVHPVSLSEIPEEDGLSRLKLDFLLDIRKLFLIDILNPLACSFLPSMLLLSCS